MPDYFFGLEADGVFWDGSVSLPVPVTCLNVLPIAGPIFGISSSMFFTALFSPRPISSIVSPWFDPALFFAVESDSAVARGMIEAEISMRHRIDSVALKMDLAL